MYSQTPVDLQDEYLDQPLGPVIRPCPSIVAFFGIRVCSPTPADRRDECLEQLLGPAMHACPSIVAFWGIRVGGRTVLSPSGDRGVNRKSGWLRLS